MTHKLSIYIIHNIHLPRSSPRWRLLFVRKKRRNLYLLPSYCLRRLALPNQSRTATQKPTPVYAISESGNISPEISCRKQDNHISTGIYRCSTLDFGLESLRDFSSSQESAWINAFLCIFTTSHPALTPDRGFCETVCDCKIKKLFNILQ